MARDLYDLLGTSVERMGVSRGSVMPIAHGIRLRAVVGGEVCTVDIVFDPEFDGPAFNVRAVADRDQHVAADIRVDLDDLGDIADRLQDARARVASDDVAVDVDGRELRHVEHHQDGVIMSMIESSREGAPLIVLHRIDALGRVEPTGFAWHVKDAVAMKERPARGSRTAAPVDADVVASYAKRMIAAAHDSAA